MATVFSKVGMGGAESMFAANAISGGVRQAAKQAAVRVGQEIPEEITTEIAHAIAADYAGTREDGLSNESLAQLAFDTTMQTIVTMGAMEGPRLAAQALSRPEQPGEQLTPEQMAEVEEFHRVQQERERLAREQQAQGDTMSPGTPTAEQPVQQPAQPATQQPVSQPAPSDTVSPGTPGGATNIGVDQIAETTADVGRGIVDGMYRKAWDDAQSGKIAKMDNPPLFEQMVLKGYQRGVVRSVDDVRSIAQGWTGEFESDKATGIANLNRLLDKYRG